MREFIEEIAARVNDRPEERFMLGITGPPGAGKSTLSLQLVSELNAYFEEKIAQAVPMDGFHLPNAVLDDRNLRKLKGVPETFDAEGFVGLLTKLRQTLTTTVLCPSFDRSLDEPSADTIVVEPWHKIVVVEGNYLLLKQVPWHQIKTLLNETWYLEVPEDVLLPRLLSRHVSGGRLPESAQEKVKSTDLPNARLIQATAADASRILRLNTHGFFTFDLGSAC